MIKQDERYHDTLLLLQKYRDVVWSLSVSVEHAKNDFRESFGEGIEDFLNSVYVAGVDLIGTDIEARAKCIERSNKMLNLVENAVTTMRERHKNGELYYQVLYYNYFSPQEYRSLGGVVDALCESGYPMCCKTMTTHRSLAVECLSMLLWGYTSKGTNDVLDKFVEE